LQLLLQQELQVAVQAACCPSYRALQLMVEVLLGV
jgi:hypothetical protein